MFLFELEIRFGRRFVLNLLEDWVVCCVDGCWCFFFGLVFIGLFNVDLNDGIFIGVVEVFCLFLNELGLNFLKLKKCFNFLVIMFNEEEFLVFKENFM